MPGAGPEAGGAVEAADCAGDHLRVKEGVKHEIVTFEKKESKSCAGQLKRKR